MLFWLLISCVVLALLALVVQKRIALSRPKDIIVLEKGVAFPDDGQADVSVEQMSRLARRISRETADRHAHGWLYVQPSALDEATAGQDLAIRVRHHFLPIQGPDAPGASPQAQGRMPQAKRRPVVILPDSPVRIGTTSMGKPIAAVWSLPGEPTHEPDFG